MQIHHPDGSTLESPHTLEEALAAVEAKWQYRPSSFAMDICRAVRRGDGTPSRVFWVHKLALEAAGQAHPPVAGPDTTGAVNFATLATFLSSSGLQRPKLLVKVPTTNGPVDLRLTLGGKASRYAGRVIVSDGKRYPASVFYGTIDQQGGWFPTRRCPIFVAEALRVLNADPQGVTVAAGKLSGTCCFCGLPLDTPESKVVGYGPVCAKHYRLPWGGKVATSQPAPVVARDTYHHPVVVSSRTPAPAPQPKLVQCFDPVSQVWVAGFALDARHSLLMTPRRVDAASMSEAEVAARTASFPALKVMTLVPVEDADPATVAVEAHIRKWLVFHGPTGYWMRRAHDSNGRERTDPDGFHWQEQPAGASRFSQAEIAAILDVGRHPWARECKVLPCETPEPAVKESEADVADALSYFPL